MPRSTDKLNQSLYHRACRFPRCTSIPHEEREQQLVVCKCVSEVWEMGFADCLRILLAAGVSVRNLECVGVRVTEQAGV